MHSDSKNEPVVEDRRIDITETLETFYVTFGSQYSIEAHPFWEKAHPEGYLRILAPDELSARAMAFGLLDQRWSMIYTEAEFNVDGEEAQRWYPRGELGLIVSTVAMVTVPR